MSEEAYEQAVEQGLEDFQELVSLFLAGVITLEILRSRYREALRLHYVRLMLAALGTSDPTENQLEELNRRVEAQELLFEGFLIDLAAGTISSNRALWRAGMYAPDRGAYIYFSVPEAVAKLMPGLPGDICLGDGLCGCYLDVSVDDEGNAVVYWVIDPFKENCAVCLQMRDSSPFIFSREQLVNA